LKIFIDTWGWLTLRDRDESRHGDVKEFYQQLRDENEMIYTSDYVVDRIREGLRQQNKL